MSKGRWWTPWKRRPRVAPASQLHTADPPETVALAPSPPVDAVAAADDAVAESAPERQLRFFCWLVCLSTTPMVGPSPCPVIGQLLEQLDTITASDSLRAGLLPRAPHIVPQLMKTLRDERYSSVDVADRISKDPALTAEVVRNASSVFGRNGETDGDDVEVDLSRAVAVIGTLGLRRAIASVVLRPIFDARGDTLSARAATQIWMDADRKARLCAVFAAEGGLDPFDGYLAGLLHNSGWTALLRAIDGMADIDVSAGDLAHDDVVPQLAMRRDALFGAIVGPWKLSPAIDRLAEEIGAVGLDSARSPLGVALRGAQRLASLRALAAPGQRPVDSVPAWALLAKPVQECYASLTGA